MKEILKKLLNKIKNIFNKLKFKFLNIISKYKLIDNKKYIISIVSFTIVILIGIITITVISNSNDTNTITYNEIESIIKNKDNIVIYYYNSRSSNKNNKKVKKYLNDTGIKYYTYNDQNVDKNEYNKFLKLLKIDKKLFGCPSLIYIREGKMYGNIINIDSTKVVEQFINNYDLYTVK